MELSSKLRVEIKKKFETFLSENEVHFHYLTDTEISFNKEFTNELLTWEFNKTFIDIGRFKDVCPFRHTLSKDSIKVKFSIREIGKKTWKDWYILEFMFE